MSDEPVILAKSSGATLEGVTLKEHTQHVCTQFEQHYLLCHAFVVDKYTRLTKGGNLVTLTVEAAQWHDEGKKHFLWQTACRKDYELWRAWKEGGEKGKKPTGIHLQKSGIRHEMDSLARMLRQKPKTSLVVQAAVAAHHSKLNYRYRERWIADNQGEFKHLWKIFVGLADEVDYTREFEEAVLRRYEYAGPRALLQLADHRASAMEDGKTLADFVPFSYEFPFQEKRGPQKEIPKLWDEALALLRAPTGAGKTDAALLWAQHQIEHGRADRLVIAMPTRFTANSLAISNAKNLSRTGLYHSSAWYQRMKQTDSSLSKEVRERIDAEQGMARLLETPITVTTLDHLCICLTGTREDHHAIFFNLAHACVVIDEADFYDTFTQANMVILLRVLKLLQVPVLLMSATLPESSRDLYGVSQIFEDTSDSYRVRCKLKTHARPIVKPSDASELMQPILEGKPAIIYANTVQRAQRYYHWLKQHMNPEHLVLYHSRFVEPDKAAIEERLRGMLGKEAWDQEKAYGCAILTQIGELSVNISADYMLSEFCPADRLVQRVGRLARFAHEPGELHLLLPHKQNKDGQMLLYPAPYGTYKPGFGWEPALVLVESAKMLVEGEYSASRFVEIVNALYAELPALDSRAKSNQKGLRELIGMNWLLQHEEDISEDADQTKKWKCRDIDPQVTVLIGMQSASQFDDDEGRQIRNYRDWQKILLEHGIACQTYEFKRALNQGCIEAVQFIIGTDGREVEKAWLVKPQFYSSTLGLNFDDPEDDDE